MSSFELEGYTVEINDNLLEKFCSKAMYIHMVGIIYRMGGGRGI